MQLTIEVEEPLRIFVRRWSDGAVLDVIEEHELLTAGTPRAMNEACLWGSLAIRKDRERGDAMNEDTCYCDHVLDEHDTSMSVAPCDVEGCPCVAFEAAPEEDEPDAA